jgi:hypothetical protein
MSVQQYGNMNNTGIIILAARDSSRPGNSCIVFVESSGCPSEFHFYEQLASKCKILQIVEKQNFAFFI